MLTGQTFQQHQPMQMPQESPSAPIIEATKKRDIETVTEVVGTKHARRAPDESSTSPKTIEPDTTQQFSPPWGVEAQELGDFEPHNIERNPLFQPKGLRASCYYVLGNVVTAFNDKSAYSITCGGYNAVTGLIWWSTRIRAHLAPGLDEVPEELAFDPSATDFLYDVCKAIGRFEEMDRLILGGMLEFEFAEGFCLVFTEAYTELVNLKMATVTTRTSARRPCTSTRRSRSRPLTHPSD